MELSKQAVSLVNDLEALAKRKLAHGKEIGMLLDLAAKHGMLPVLDELSFYAKFAYKTHGIMRRIGKDGEGYEKLSKEFGEGILTAQKLLKQIIAEAPDETKRKFDSAYMALSPATLENLLAFFQDLSWYKNYRIDSRGR